MAHSLLPIFVYKVLLEHTPPIHSRMALFPLQQQSNKQERAMGPVWSPKEESSLTSLQIPKHNFVFLAKNDFSPLPFKIVHINMPIYHNSS